MAFQQKLSHTLLVCFLIIVILCLREASLSTDGLQNTNTTDQPNEINNDSMSSMSSISTNSLTEYTEQTLDTDTLDTTTTLDTPTKSTIDDIESTTDNIESTTVNIESTTDNILYTTDSTNSITDDTISSTVATNPNNEEEEEEYSDDFSIDKSFRDNNLVGGRYEVESPTTRSPDEEDDFIFVPRPYTRRFWFQYDLRGDKILDIPELAQYHSSFYKNASSNDKSNRNDNNGVTTTTSLRPIITVRQTPIHEPSSPSWSTTTTTTPSLRPQTTTTLRESQLPSSQVSTSTSLQFPDTTSTTSLSTTQSSVAAIDRGEINAKIRTIFFITTEPGLHLFNLTDNDAQPYPTPTASSDEHQRPIWTSSNTSKPTKQSYYVDVNDCLEKGKSFCTKVRNYPDLTNVEQALKKNYPDLTLFLSDDVAQPNDITQRMNFDPLEESLCKTREKIIYPEAGETTSSNWSFILNNDNYKQGIRIEECEVEGSSCNNLINLPNNYAVACKQHYIYRSLVALTPDGKLTTDLFKMPSCCKCVLRHNDDFN